jgi:hemolysin III
MTKPKFLTSTVEEIANTITHGFGLLLSVIGFVFLVVMASLNGDAWHIASSVVYGLSLVVLYGASTFYHGATDPKSKKILQIIDHCCIYLLIAGSYTPFTLVVLRDGFGLSLFAFVWIFAIASILLKIFFGDRFIALFVLSYLVMGWIGVIAIQPLLAALGAAPIALIVAGGLAYTLGVIFFSWERLPHHHAIWHVFVLTGSILHFLAVAIYVIPYAVSA